MPVGGTLLIETHNVIVDERYAAKHQPMKPGRYVMFAVTDSGSGMTPEIKARIFEPFFTTKEPGKGTGLGLATVYGIVNQSSGHIHVDSSPGTGTRFEIYLPQTDQQLPSAVVSASTMAQPRRSETLLIAEDEDAVRALACEFLQSAGYQVLTAADGHEALEIAERLNGAIQILVTDVVMPRMRGPELARRIQQKLPHVKVIFISGYTEEIHGTTNAIGENSFLQKPFSRAQLLQKLADALHSQKPLKPQHSEKFFRVN
jgi:two-component system cell cycle sensor histidine kinase/response regulator CckA